MCYDENSEIPLMMSDVLWQIKHSTHGNYTHNILKVIREIQNIVVAEVLLVNQRFNQGPNRPKKLNHLSDSCKKMDSVTVSANFYFAPRQYQTLYLRIVSK